MVFVCSSNSLVVLVFADSRLSLSAFASFWGNEMVGFVFLMLHLVYDRLIALSVTHLYRRRHSSVPCFFAERK